MGATNTSVLFDVPAREIRRRELRQFARQLEQDVAAERPFSCLITGDGALRDWNRRFLGKDYATDVLSFPAAAPSSELGEIAISYDRARDQAAGFGHDTASEVRVLMLHGVLHLIGMDHERDRGEMARAEQRWRKHYGLPSGLIERVRA